MARQKKPRPEIDYRKPTSLRVLLEKFCDWLDAHNYAATTIEIRHDDLTKFIDWSEERALEEVSEINRRHLENYQRWLANYRKADGKYLDVESQGRFISSVRVFFRWLSKQEYINNNPATEITSPRLGKRLPKVILSEREMEEVLQQPDLKLDRGVRDRAILETLYSTGIRRAELARLRLIDLDRDRGMLAVRGGKGAKDRVIPIGERAQMWIEKYLVEVRAYQREVIDEEYLFINSLGRAWSIKGLGGLVGRYVRQAGLGKIGGCHMFRHTCATLMLEGGADIRYIQQMLGHEELSTTQIYTQVSDRKLKEVHSRAHPGAQMYKKKQRADEMTDDELEE